MTAEKPILMSAPMVRAILAGTKTQTRRVWKLPRGCEWYGEMGGQSAGWFVDVDPGAPWWMHVSECRCPYGQPGDRLWGRETHAPQPDCWGSWDRWMRGEGGPGPIIHYKATEPEAWVDRWRPSIHMPRWASRITLEITGVRVEKLQDISEADAQAEGADPFDPCDHVRQSCADIGCQGPSDYRGGYRVLWEQINGPGSWYANPWVWVIEFRRATA